MILNQFVIYKIKLFGNKCDIGCDIFNFIIKNMKFSIIMFYGYCYDRLNYQMKNNVVLRFYFVFCLVVKSFFQEGFFYGQFYFIVNIVYIGFLVRGLYCRFNQCFYIENICM